jgi:hypothetical protein
MPKGARNGPKNEKGLFLIGQVTFDEQLVLIFYSQILFRLVGNLGHPQAGGN